MTKKTTVKAKDATAKIVVSKSGRKFVQSSKGVDFWNPEKKGDSIEGEFIEWMEFKGGKFAKEKNAKGEPVSRKPVILVTDIKGKETQVALPDTTNIVNFMKEVVKGDFVMIEYNGKVIKKGQEKKKNPESFHSYDLYKEYKG